MSKPTTEVEVQRMLEMKAAGATIREISVEVGKSSSVVFKILNRFPTVPAGPPPSLEAMRAEKERTVLNMITRKDIAQMTPAMRLSAVRTLSKGTHSERRRKERAAAGAELRAGFAGRTVDLSLALTTDCLTCGLPRACKGAPVCRVCSPDVPFVPAAEEEGVASFTRITPCRGCGLNFSTLEGLCNACRGVEVANA